MKIYVDSKERYKETKSTGWSFLIVGIIDLAFVILLWLDLLPIDITNRIMITAVMGIVFAIFVLVAIKSFVSLKHISTSGSEQEKLMEDISSWFISEYKDQMLVQFDASEDANSEELYLQRFDFIFENVKAKYSDTDESVIDHVSEVIYSEIFNEK